MPASLRIILFAVALAVFFFVLRSIRRSKMNIDEGIYWNILSFLILLLSIFPGISYWLSDLLGFQSPVNLIFLVFIFLLLIRQFRLSEEVSRLSTKLSELAMKVAIDSYEHKAQDRNVHAQDSKIPDKKVETTGAREDQISVQDVDGSSASANPSTSQ